MPIEPSGQTWNLGAKGGLLFPGTVNVEGYDADTEMGFMLGSYIDALIVPKLSLGAYADFYHTSTEIGGYSASVLSLGGTIKGRFCIRGLFELRPGVSFGYNYTSIEDADDGAHGYNIAGKLEAAIPVREHLNALVEISFLSQPAGGTGDADVTWAPIFFLAAGIEYAN